MVYGISGGTPVERLAGDTGFGGMRGSDFLRILVAQLSSQDPIEPMKNSEFIDQVVQLSLLERLESAEKTQALGWLGKNVRLKGEGEHAGTVEALRFMDGGVYVIAGGRVVPVDSISDVW